MYVSELSALSPLDGRYAHDTRALAPIFSEWGLMRARLTAEIAWLVGLGDEPGVLELAPFSPAARGRLAALLTDFDESAGAAVKAIEARTNHDVKAIEYYLRDFVQHHDDLKPAAEFVHFALTSEDVNNVAYALMAQTGRDTVLIPALDSLITGLDELARATATIPMLARTHGQPASPTTVGKEIRVFVTRLTRARAPWRSVPLLAKMNGAVGNYNAHYAAYPEVDWPAVATRVLAGLGLSQNPHTTQIEPHDGLAELCHATARINTILIDLARDLWGYIALGYFRQKTRAGEVGSSTMPHKVNPIDFENAEGNLGLANALLDHLAAKLPISRFQRDLSDSTVLRNIGSAFGYTLLAYRACARGLGKLMVDEDRVRGDLDCHVEVLTEAVQTVMRRYGLAGGYENLKDLSRGRALTAEDLRAFIEGLALPAEVRETLRTLTPATYVGNAPAQAQDAPRP
ncbi:adenylosuccinate lyase [Acidiferrobacter sp.]|uniref:adenylosuccinate lyase n=1 Tax=Acidiferrobacter sp. TaxID=1872107 RepID=UPI0034307C07